MCYSWIVFKHDCSMVKTISNKGEGLYCRHERESSQWHQEESRAERKSSLLNMTNRLDVAMREIRVEQREGMRDTARGRMRENRERERK